MEPPAAAAPVDFIELGTIGAPDEFVFDTIESELFGSSSGDEEDPGADTEMALYAASGLLLDQNDDAIGRLSEITTVLDAGRYFLAISAFSSTIENGSENTGPALDFG